MKKIIMLLCMLTMTACGNSNVAYEEETKKKIETAGWKIEYEKPDSLGIETINLNVSDTVSFTISKYEEDISGISYMKQNAIESYSISHEEGKEYALYANKTDSNETYECLRYNITDDKETKNSEDGKCSVEKLNVFTEEIKERDTLLEKNKLTFDELSAFAKWYFDKQ